MEPRKRLASLNRQSCEFAEKGSVALERFSEHPERAAKRRRWKWDIRARGALRICGTLWTSARRLPKSEKVKESLWGSQTQQNLRPPKNPFQISGRVAFIVQWHHGRRLNQQNIALGTAERGARSFNGIPAILGFKRHKTKASLTRDMSLSECLLVLLPPASQSTSLRPDGLLRASEGHVALRGRQHLPSIHFQVGFMSLEILRS